MKSNKQLIALFLLGFVLTGTNSSYSAKPKGLKKGPNMALSITNKKKDPPQTYVNIGLLSNYANLQGFGLNAISSITHQYVKGIQVAGITNVTGLNMSGLQIAGIANVTGKTSNGMVLSGLMNVSGKEANGFQLSGIGNVVNGSTRGFFLGGLINLSGKSSGGVHIAGLANINGQDYSGMSIGGLMNVNGNSIKGVQLSALLNVAGESNKGVQLAGLGNVTVNNKGLQLGLANYSEQNRGLQIGVSNVETKRNKGWQLGLINISQDSISARQIGLVNWNPRTRPQLIISGGNLNKVNVAVRFKNQHTYTQIGTGAYYFDTDAKFSFSAFYRAGVYYPILPQLEISADMGYYHIESLKNKDNGYPARLYALQPRVNIEYNISKKIGIFASGGYSWTKTYGHSGSFDDKATFEVGIILF